MIPDKSYETERDEAAEKHAETCGFEWREGYTPKKFLSSGFSAGYDACNTRFEKIIETMEKTTREVENARRKILEEKTEKILSLEKIVAEKNTQIDDMALEWKEIETKLAKWSKTK